MQYRQYAHVSALKRAQQFFKKHAARLGEYAVSPARARLDEVVNDLDAAASGQQGTTRVSQADTALKHELRDALRNQHMRAISAIARARLAGIEADTMRCFDVPHSRASDVALLASGRAMSTAAGRYADILTREGLPPDFLDQLDAAVDALQSAIDERNGEYLERRRLTLGIVGGLHMAREVLDILTAFVHKQFARAPEIVGEWKSAIRIAAKPGVPRGSTFDVARVGTGTTGHAPLLALWRPITSRSRAQNLAQSG